MLILLIYKYERFFHLLIPSSISFFSDMKLSFTCLVRVVPIYVILFETVVKGVVYLISYILAVKAACLYRMIVLICSQIWFASILLGIYASMFMKEIDL